MVYALDVPLGRHGRQLTCLVVVFLQVHAVQEQIVPRPDVDLFQLWLSIDQQDPNRQQIRLEFSPYCLTNAAAPSKCLIELVLG
jgi:hypothetical protein